MGKPFIVKALFAPYNALIRSFRRNDRKKLIRAKDLLEEYIAANKGFQEIHVMFDFS